MKKIVFLFCLVASQAYAQGVACPHWIGINANNVLEYCDAQGVTRGIALGDTAGTPTKAMASQPVVLTGSANLDFAATVSNACVNGPSTITVNGAVVGDVVDLGVPAAAIGTGVFYDAWVSSANTVTVRSCKLGTTAFNAAAGTYTAKIIR